MKRILLLLCIVFMLASCENDFDRFETMAEAFAKTDGTINSKELNGLKDEIKLFADDRAFKRFYTNGNADEAKVLSYLKAKGYKVVVAPAVNHAKDTINVYIENSGSMFGYASGDTYYKDALTELLVQMGSTYGKKQVNLYFINTAIYPIAFEGNVAQYPGTLSPDKMKIVGDVTSSDINDIYRQILEKTPKNTVSVLLSDCIYSVSGDQDTAGKLERQKSLTKDVFQDSGITTLVVKLNSSFNGFYYPKNNIKQKIANQTRPYYISVLGLEEAIGFFYDSIKFNSDFKGYENKVVLSPTSQNTELYYTIVNTKTSSGFRPIRELSETSSIKGIEDVEVNERNGGKFTFSIAVDMHNIPVEEDVIIDAANYSVTDEYTITISKYSEKSLKPNSVQQIAKSGATPTHLITVTAKASKYPDLKFALKKQIPKWVYNTSTNDDTNIKELGSKTFGFKYLVEGINEAAQAKASSDNYFEINIKINN